MQNRILIVLFVFNLGFCFSQKQADNWFFGQNAGVTFTGSAISVTPNGQITSSLGAAAVSDPNGNLLFYTDGMNVYSQSHTLMANGSGLAGAGAFQPAIVVKQPQSNNIFYIFTVGGINTSNGFNYSIVDMSLASGSGSVTAKNISIHSGCRDKITATKHCNSNDIWIVSTNYNSNPAFISCLLTSAGVATVLGSPTSSIGSVLGTGQMKISPNGHKLGVNSSTVNTGSYYLDTRVFDFEPATGEIQSSNIQVYNYGSVQSSGSGTVFVKNHGCEFSPSSRYFYFSWFYSLVKTDLCSPNILVGASTVLPPESTQEDTAQKRSMQLARDGKIYVALTGKSKLGIIQNPNSSSVVPTYTDVSITTYTCKSGLPNFPGYYFEQRPALAFTYSTGLSCLTASFDPVPICSSFGYSVTGYQWSFGDPASGTNNISFLQNPSHTYPIAGTYSVMLIRYLQCNKIDTTYQLINVTQPTLATMTSTNCLGTTATVQVSGGSGPFIYLWSANSQTGTVANFSTSGIYTINVVDQGAGNCIRSSTIAVTVPTIIVGIVVNPTIICFGANNGQVTVNVTGGSGNYMYTNAQNTQSSSVISNLSPGIQTVTVSDFGFSCQLTQTFFIATAPLLNIQTSVSPPQVCEGDSISIINNISGGIGNLSYSWSPVTANTNTIRVAPLAGTQIFSFTVTDNIGCSKTQTVPISINPNPTLVANSVSVCVGNTTILNVNGAITYTWMPGGFVGSAITKTANANAVYTVMGSNNFGCISTKIVSLTALPLPTVSATCNSPLCEGQIASFYSGTASTFVWQGPNNFYSNQQNPQILNTISGNSGIYQLIATDLNGCKNSSTVNLIINALPLVSVIAYTNSICLGQQLNVSAIGANTYTWTNGSSTNSVLIAPSNNTIMQVTGTDTLTGCVATGSFAINVKKCNPAGIESLNQDDDLFRIFPNPNQGDFSIQSPGPAKFSIVDALGRIIFEGEVKTGQNPIRIISPTKGIYLIKIFYLELVIDQKLIID